MRQPLRITTAPSARRLRQRGAATAEFALTAVPLLLAGTAVAEAGHWMMTRQVVRLALHEASRAGAVRHAHPDAIRAAFEDALTPLHSPAGAHGSPLARMHAAHARLARDTGMVPWRVEVLGPPAAAYRDFGRASASHGGRLAIANDYLAEQHARALSRWPRGAGPQSGLDVHDANVLHLRVTYLKRPLTPLVGAVLKAVSFAAPAHAQTAFSAGLLSMRMESRMTMQSDPVAWDLPGGAITGGYNATRPPAHESPPGQGTPAPPLEPPPGNLAPAPPDTRPPPPHGAAPSPDPIGPDDDRALCGVVLCCE